MRVDSVAVARKLAALGMCMCAGWYTDAPRAATNESARRFFSELKVESPSSHPKFAGYEALVAATQNGCPDGHQVRRLVSLTQASAKDSEPIELFFLPPLVRLLHQFRSCFTAEDLNSIRLNLTSRRHQLFTHGTVNHAAMRATSWYLLAQLFPSEKWTDWDGRQWTSVEVQRRIRTNLIARWEGIYAKGHSEWLSPTYAIINLFPALNIYDFARDPDLREGANAEANLDLAIMLANSFNGVLLPPLTRKNFEQRNASAAPITDKPSVSQAAIKFYTGDPKLLTNTEWTRGGEPPYIVMLALSNWRPIFPADVFKKEKIAFGVYIKTATPGFSEWGRPSTVEIIGESIITNEYSISAGNAIFRPDEYYDHIQTSGVNLSTDGEFGQIECYHPYFSNKGKKADWSTDRWSPFLQSTLTSATTLVLRGFVPEYDPWPGSLNSTHAAKRRSKDGRTTRAVFCRVPRQFKTTHRDPQRLSVTNGRTTVDISSKTAPLRPLPNLLSHVQYVIDSSKFDITFQVNTKGRSHQFIPKANAPEFQEPRLFPDGFVSFEKLNAEAAATPPISGSVLSLNNGIMRIDSKSQAVIFECTARVCRSFARRDDARHISTPAK